MIKRILLVVAALLLLAGGLAGVKALQIRRMIEQGKQFAPPPETVTSAPVRLERWESSLSAVGSLSAVRGVTVAADQPGKVVDLSFDSGGLAKKGALLVHLDSAAEQAQLRALESSAGLAKTNLRRMAELVAKGFIAQADYDSAEAGSRQAEAQADALRAVIAKKSIRAPFAGRLGIRLVNLGQMLREGEAVVSLQQLDPILVNFSLPQRDLARIAVGMPVRLAGEAGSSGGAKEGRIVAINPELDAKTRNVLIQARLANRDESLRPGMFVKLAVLLPERPELLVIPATAVLPAPYGDSVFVVEAAKGDKAGAAGKTVRQQFVRLGERRGDFVVVLSGLAGGQTVAGTGVFKLRNGQAVVIDNRQALPFALNPTPENN